MTGRRQSTPVKRGRIDSRWVNRAIARVSGRQSGNVARWQLLKVGVPGNGIDRRLRNGLLIEVVRGVYAYGTPDRSFRSRCWVAVLQAGPGAVVSHLAALWLWGVRKAEPAVIDVTCPRRCRKATGVRFHTTGLPRDEVSDELGIPVTTAARSVFDSARYLQPAQTEAVMNEIEAQQGWSTLSYADLLKRHPRRRGAPVLRRIVDAERIGLTRVHEGTETDFIAFVDAHGLRRPVTDVMIGDATTAYEADAVWHDQMVDVELDSRWHETRRARERDRRRDRNLAALGWTVVRLTAADLRADPDGVASSLRILLGDQGRRAADSRSP